MFHWSVCMYTMYVPIDPLELRLWMIVSHHVDAET